MAKYILCIETTQFVDVPVEVDDLEEIHDIYDAITKEQFAELKKQSYCGEDRYAAFKVDENGYTGLQVMDWHG